LVVPFVVFTVLYIFLAVVVAWLLFRQVAQSPGASGEHQRRSEEDTHLVA
jgi:cytochrome bd-type quinol oxidase subunit 1